VTDNDKNQKSNDSQGGVWGVFRVYFGGLIDRLPREGPTVAILIVLGIVALVAVVAIVWKVNDASKYFLALFVLAVYVISALLLTGSTQKKGDTIALATHLSKKQRDGIYTVLCEAAKRVATELGLPLQLARSNLFGVDNRDRMRVLKGLTYNMNDSLELTIKIAVGYGSTGRCFKSAKENIAIFEEGWGKDQIEDEEIKRVHPELQWIISVPVKNEDDRPFWVLNVDGLQKRYDEKHLKEALRHLWNYAQMISDIVAKGSSAEASTQ